MSERVRHKWKVHLTTADGGGAVEEVECYWDPENPETPAAIANATAATFRAKGAEGVMGVSAELIGGS